MPLAYIRMLRRGEHPGNELPSGGYEPVDPGFGGGIGAPPDPGYDLPMPPPGVWPPPNATLPIVPAPPGTPPGAIWPPVGNPPIWSGGVNPPHPGGGPMPGRPARPDQGLPPGQPARPDQGLPGASGGTFWIVAGIPGVGWRYVCVDPSLVAGMPLPPAPEPKG